MKLEKGKKNKIKEIASWGPYLRKEWEKHFANHLSDQEKKRIYLSSDRDTSGDLWHLFSYKKKKCLEGEKAETAFNSERKSKCYIFYQDSDYALLLENAEGFSNSDLMVGAGNDVYVVDKEFRWTFVITHETYWCGPYFSRKGMAN
ncbi:DUF4275 family protein [Priestia filamentosa]|uniref:DUF4275 family protein n=1 Tax=Priestia filamentosa TaxID=1402861 RepID=UPI0039829CAA